MAVPERRMSHSNTRHHRPAWKAAPIDDRTVLRTYDPRIRRHVDFREER